MSGEQVVCEIEELLREGDSLALGDYQICHHNGYFAVYSDETQPSYWFPVGGWDDLTHQRYGTFADAFRAARTLWQKATE